MTETFISAFINLSKIENNSQRRNPEIYIKHAKKLLSQDIFLYLFLEEDMIELCKKEREQYNLLEKTHIEKITFETLPCYSHFEKIKEGREKNPVVNACGFKDTVSYITTVNSKIGLVYKAMQENPFLSTKFAWIDFGIFHVAKTDFIDIDKPFSLSDQTGKIKLEWLKPWKKDDALNLKKQYTNIHGNIAAGYITGDIDHWSRFHKVFYEEFEHALEKNFAPSEEQIFPVLIEKYPDLFDFYAGTYDSILSNFKRQRIDFMHIQKQYGKLMKDNKNLAEKIGDEFFRQMQLGLFDDSTITPNLYLGLLVSIYRVKKGKYGIHSDECKQIKRFFNIKSQEKRYIFFKDKITIFSF